jgi:hypothetical protein
VSVGSRALVSVSIAVSCWFHETLLYLAHFQLLSFFSLQLISFHVIDTVSLVSRNEGLYHLPFTCAVSPEAGPGHRTPIEMKVWS